VGASTGIEVRIVCGLMASAARLVPVPLLDDILREKAIHLLVARTLRQHGRTFRSKNVAPLYGDPRGCMHGCLTALVWVPVKLLLFPIRKILTWVMAAKNLARDLSEAVLLGRILDRALVAGRLPVDASPDALHAEADLMRRAFDNAVQGTDMTLLRGLLRQAVKGVSGLPRAAMHAARALRRSDDDASDDLTEGLAASDRAKVDAGARQISSALATPEATAFLDAFDARFDENLAILQQRSAGAPR
jgi:hypothetical protein